MAHFLGEKRARRIETVADVQALGVLRERRWDDSLVLSIGLTLEVRPINLCEALMI
ncbi:hypothetical protein [Micromonospora sp. HUAS LYJ1]|uniref:hypothetical protein n=1 Tax=Micromonospora sp. HUAS LYJ1 TaxID=3061626 RepID=UPI002671D86C|nr:hypothetical protein [Micromonospora sp. HUAS LYJ1]WKU03778.1 hypothetical protein Q2K16_23480 [Micromonospora sp. HUAS LYJ1]